MRPGTPPFLLFVARQGLKFRFLRPTPSPPPLPTAETCGAACGALLLIDSIIVVGSGLSYGDKQDMPITAEIVRITLKGTFLNQKWQSVQHFAPVGAAWLTADALAGAQAWWDNVKAAWRASVPANAGFTFDSVLFEEIGAGLGFGEYAIPAAEQLGTRTGTSGDFLPTFAAAGVKLTVGSRVTRPGQKRFPGGMEMDSTGSAWTAAYITIIDALADKYDTSLTLGAPVATGNLQPKVVRLAADGVTVVASQDVVGHVTNPNVTSQVSRKIGHGS